MNKRYEFAEKAIKEFYKTHFKNSIHNTFTPFSICSRMINKIDEYGTNIFVVNPEFAYILIKIRDVAPDHIIALIDNERKEVLYKELGITRFVKHTDLMKHSYSYDINNSELKDMNFSAMIGNPAYNKNFHLEMLEKALEHLEDGGTCVWLHPVRWAIDPLAKYKGKGSAYNKYKHLPWKELEFISAEDANKVFETNIPVDLSISTLNKNYKIDPSYLIDSQAINITQKIINHNDFLKAHIDELKDDGIRVKIKTITSKAGGSHGAAKDEGIVSVVLHKYDQVFIDGLTADGVSWRDLGNKNGQIKKSIPNSIQFNTYDEAKNFESSVKTKIYMGIVGILKHNSHVPIGYLPYLKNYTKTWSDKDMIKLFKFTDEEVKYIYKVIKEYI